MDEIARERRRLARVLKQRFGEDANLAKTLLMVPLRAAFGMRVEKADRPSYLAALERLPKHTAMKPGFPLISKARDGRWRVSFANGPLLHESSRRFSTHQDAAAWATDFLMRWAKLSSSRNAPTRRLAGS